MKVEIIEIPVDQEQKLKILKIRPAGRPGDGGILAIRLGRPAGGQAGWLEPALAGRLAGRLATSD